MYRPPPQRQLHAFPLSDLRVQNEANSHSGPLLPEHEATQGAAVAVLLEADGPLAGDADVRRRSGRDASRSSLQHLKQTTKNNRWKEGRSRRAVQV